MKGRILYYDFLRSIAIVAVVTIHSNSIGYKFGDHSFNFIASAVIRQLVSFGVPLFLAISGYFLATKPVDTKFLYISFLKKQIPRVLIPLIIWSIFYVALDYLNGGKPISLIKKAITFQASAPFYYILLIIQFYVLLPILQRIGRNKLGLVLSLLVSLFCCIIIYYLRYQLVIDLPLVLYAGNFATWIVFFVLGIYLKRNTIKVKKAWLLLFCIFAFFLSLFETSLLYHNYGQIIESVTAVKPSSFIYSFFLIIFLFSFKEGINSRIMTYVGELSFGIFFLHMIILTSLKLLITKNFSNVFDYSILVQIALVTFIIGLCILFGQLMRAINPKMSSKYLGF